jgi:hypothetical protein
MTLDSAADQVQRTNVVDQRGAFSTQVRLFTVVHGTLTNGGFPASLIIMYILFHSARADRRARQAEVSFEFSYYPDTRSEGAPEVLKISPEYEVMRAPLLQRLQQGPSYHLFLILNRKVSL